MARIVKSVFWLVGFSSLGYCLFEIATPNESELLAHLPEGNSSNRKDIINKRKAIVGVLISAAEAEQPLYRLTKEQIEETVIKKY